MAQAKAQSSPVAVALRADGVTVATVLPPTDVFVLVLSRLEVIGLELIGIIRRLPVGAWRMTEVRRP
jgi:hypothetical protein